MAKIIDFNTAAAAKALSERANKTAPDSADNSNARTKADGKNTALPSSDSGVFKRGKILAFSAAEQTQDMIADTMAETMADTIIAAALPDTSPEARPCALHMTLVFLIKSAYAEGEADFNPASYEKQAFIHDHLVRKLTSALEQTLAFATDTVPSADTRAQTPRNLSPVQQENLLNCPLLCAFIGRDDLFCDPSSYPPEEPAYKTVYAGFNDIGNDSFDLWERLHEIPQTPVTLPEAHAKSPYEACLHSYELCCAHVAISTRKECWDAATPDQRYFTISLKTQELESLIAEPLPDAAARALAWDSLTHDFMPFLDRIDEQSKIQRHFAQLCKTHHMRLLRLESRADNATPAGPK